MKKFLFVDLDDTLFQTPEKCGTEERLHPVAYLKDDSVCSFSTPRQRDFFETMHRQMTVIPTTARNYNALNRVDLPFSSYSIIDYGGVILEPDRTPDKIWMEIIHSDMVLAFDGLKEAMEQINAYSFRMGLKGQARLIEDYSIPFYVIVKDPDKQVKHLEMIEREVLAPWIASVDDNFYIHRNGNNLAVLPKMLNKSRAVLYLHKKLQQEYGEIMTFGMGDSQSDARFMAACDYAIIPGGTQLAALTLAVL